MDLLSDESGGDRGWHEKEAPLSKESTWMVHPKCEGIWNKIAALVNRPRNKESEAWQETHELEETGISSIGKP